MTTRAIEASEVFQQDRDIRLDKAQQEKDALENALRAAAQRHNDLLTALKEEVQSHMRRRNRWEEEEKKYQKKISEVKAQHEQEINALHERAQRAEQRALGPAKAIAYREVRAVPFQHIFPSSDFITISLH